jgi:protocatechuate 3,4-dioxygenase beta subunit
MAETARRITMADGGPATVDLALTERRPRLEWPFDEGQEPHGPYVADSETEQAATVTSRIEGTVVEDGTDRPLRGVVVTVNAPGFRGRTIGTDERGAFQFDQLTPGRFLLAASKPGYLPVEYGATQTGRPGTPVPVTAGSTAAITIKLARAGVVSGRVLDENGRPLPTVLVRVMTLRPAVSGGSELVPVAGAIESRADAAGNYRIYGLSPGEYYIAALPDYAGAGFGGRQVTAEELQWSRQPSNAPASEPRRGAGVIYAATLYPSARNAGAATTVRLAPGEERTGLDIQVSLVPSVKVTAVAVTPDGAKAVGVLVRLGLTDRSAVAPPPNGSGAQRTMPDGRAVFTEVTPGLYDVIALVTPTTQPGSTPAGLWAQTTVAISDRDMDVSIALQPPLSVAGRVVFDGAPPAALSSLRVSLTNPSSTGAPSIAPSPLDANGRFTVSGVTPGDYRVSVAGLPKPWTPQSAVAGDADLLDALLTLNADKSPDILVTLTDHPAELSGSFVDASGRPASEYSVVVMSTDARYWVRGSRRVQTVRPGLDGRFVFTGLPPGDYGLCAFTDFEPGDLTDSDFLRRALSQAVRVTIAPGEKKVQNLRVSVGG